MDASYVELTAWAVTDLTSLYLPGGCFQLCMAGHRLTVMTSSTRRTDGEGGIHCSVSLPDGRRLDALR